MKTVHIIGVGMNAPTVRAVETVQSCDVLLGAPRQLAVFAHLDKPAHAEYRPDAVRRIIEMSDAESFAVLLSGDIGFFSGARALIDALPDFDVRLTPGVPAVCELFARLGLPWQDAALISMHALDSPLVDTVRRNRLIFCLTGGNVREIGVMLSGAGFGGLTVHVGENLGYPGERVFTVTAAELTDETPMTSLVIVNNAPDASTPTGLPDTAFDRLDGVPMTKSEVRAVIMSKLRLRPHDICYDVGAGSGSVTVEMALAVYSGRICAVERNADALGLARANCSKFHIGNVSFIEGSAPDALINLPAPDAVFIGGSGGDIGDIINVVRSKNPSVRVVATAIALETASAALAALPNAELVQIGVARAERRAGLHMMTAQNPIFIISGGGTSLKDKSFKLGFAPSAQFPQKGIVI